MRKKFPPPTVFFNASVILAGLHSPSGGSGKLLTWQQKKYLRGTISEIVLDEVIRRASKIRLTQAKAKKRTTSLFKRITAAPPQVMVEKQLPKVVDSGDAHLLASAIQGKVQFLVSLDKKHVLALKEKIKQFKIVSPKQLIELLSED